MNSISGKMLEFKTNPKLQNFHISTYLKFYSLIFSNFTLNIYENILKRKGIF